MSSKELLRSLLIFVLLAAVLAVSAFALEGVFPNVPPLPPEVIQQLIPEPTPEPEPEFECPLELKTGHITHTRYISGYDDGSFRPDKTMTRAEAAVMIYGLLAEVPAERAEFADVSAADWYYDAIGVLAASGIIVDEDENAEPMAEISRGEFVAMLSRFFPADDSECSFTDVLQNNPYYEHIAKATTLGWISGYDDGMFHPYRTITRAEAATVINNVLGRSADAAYADAIILPLFKDVSPEHWAYYEIMEASLTHSPTMIHDVDESWHYVDTEPLRRPAGPLFIGQECYYIDDATGLPVHDAYVGELYFGPDGRYTSGDEEIDSYAKLCLQRSFLRAWQEPTACALPMTTPATASPICAAIITKTATPAGKWKMPASCSAPSAATATIMPPFSGPLPVSWAIMPALSAVMSAGPAVPTAGSR